MKSRLVVLFTAVVMGCPVLTFAQANLVTNGDFESGAASWTEWSSPGGWTTDVFAHDYASGVPIWPPIPYPYAGAASHGQHVGTNNVHGGIYQVINVQAGLFYDVSGVWSGGIGELGSLPFDIAWFEVTVYQGAVGAAEIDAAPGPGDVIIAKREYSGDSIVSFGWEQFNGSFIAEQDQVTLAFKTGKVSGNWHPIAAFHDNIAVRLVSVEIPTGGRSGVLVFIIALAAAGIMALSRRVG
jgi:hypothetical protein